jgi:hypothetical protein
MAVWRMLAPSPSRVTSNSSQARRQQGHPFHQGPDEFEGEAAGAQHDRGAQLQHRDPASAQHLTHFPATPEMAGQAGLLAAESTKVDDPLNAG